MFTGLKKRGGRKRAIAAAAALLSVAAAHASGGGFHENGFRLLRVGGEIVKWGPAELGAGASVTYAFIETATVFSDARNCGVMTPATQETLPGVTRAAFEHEARGAFAMWSAAANVEFRPAAPGEAADIMLGVQPSAPGPAFADILPQTGTDGVRPLSRGLVCVNGDETWKLETGAGGGKRLRYALAHEIGHALGLDHAGANGALMAFRYTDAFDTLQDGDIAGVRLLYGERSAMAAAPMQQAAR